ncbi:ABC transporter permease [Reinekea sp. G2M2-21]|uniref:ABC transporter permease n=1 Tax=Reinekea sp. G2M2-21 TaxID=2788942 RepID=UPI0018AC22F7|nr:ABC transporter permease [Reinekea sp. G2M2-21]
MELSILQVSMALVPILIAIVIYGTMVSDWTSVIWATIRMVVQLIAIGYALNIIFGLNHPLWVILVILLMSLGAGWIAMRPIKQFNRPKLPVMVSVIVSGAINLIWILAFVLQPDPWFEPSVLIPITGMVMANSMNAVSLCAERFWSERKQGNSVDESSLAALTAAMIPQINALLAVGLVSLPGMMTGQILSGVSPLIAVRYQIVIMSMVLSTAAFGSFIYLRWYRNETDQKN